MKKILTLLFSFACFTSQGQVITTVAGTGTAGYAGDGGSATAAQMNTVTGIAVDASANMYISDYTNHRIRKVSASGIMTTIAGTGIAGDGGDGGPATAAQIWRPSGIIIDAAGNIVFSDCDNHKVRKIDPSGIITTIAGNGTAGYSGDGGPASAAQLHYPEAIAIDGSGNMYFADFNNNCIRKVDVSGTISTIAGTSIAGYSGDGGPATNAQLHSPETITVDGYNNIFIADDLNNTVREIQNSTTYAASALENVKNFKVYPNPVSTNLILECRNELYTSYSVTNIFGGLKMAGPINNTMTKIELARLPAGIYFITAYGLNVRDTKSVVKQ